MADILLYKKNVLKVKENTDFDIYAAYYNSGNMTSALHNPEITDLKLLSSTEPHNTKRYATMEANEWRLNGKHTLYNDGYDKVGFWSKEISSSIGSFNYYKPYPALTLRFKAEQSPETIDGITIIAADGESYCTDIVLRLYLNGTRVYTSRSVQTSPIISLGISDTFDAIELAFLKTNKPNRFIKISDIKLGYAEHITSDKFYDLQVLEDISLVSDTIPINNLTFTVNEDKTLIDAIKSNTYIELYNDCNQFGSYWLTNLEKSSNDKYKVTAQDIINVLDKTEYSANMFLSLEDTDSISVADVIDNIMSGVECVYTTDDNLTNSVISIKFTDTTKRGALAQTLLVSNAVCLKRRNGSLWFGRLNTTSIKRDVTEDLFADYRIVDNAPVASLQMKGVIYANGEQYTTSDLDISIASQTQDYIKLRVSMPTVISSQNLEILLQYTMAFYQDGPASGMTATNPYVIHTGIKNFGTSDTYAGGYKYMSEKFSIGSSEIIIQLDRDTISLNSPRALNAVGTRYVDRWEGQNIYDANTKIHPYLDFTKATFKKENLRVTYNELDIVESDAINTVSNPVLLTNELNTQDLAINTIDIARLEVNGVSDNTIDALMDRYYKYNKQFEGTMLADKIQCGDTIQMTLTDLGTVMGSIMQLQYNNPVAKLIAKAKIYLYYTGSEE